MNGLRRLGAAHLVIDESTAMATARDDPRAGRLGFWATGLAVFVCWNAGTVIGAAGASVLADPRTLGLDAAAPAAFLALIGPRLLRRETAIVATLAVRGGACLDALCRRWHPGAPRGARRRGRRASATGWGRLMWAAVLAGSVGCYVLKLAGVSVPQRVLADPRVRHIGALLPVALLSALVATQTFSTGQDLVVDARAAGLAVAAVAVLARAPFLVVVASAAGATALVRALT